MKKRKTLFWSLLLFFCWLIFYAIAAANQNSTSIIPMVATKITIMTTYPARVVSQIFGIKLNGLYLTLNFILVSIIPVLAFIKITTKRIDIK